MKIFNIIIVAVGLGIETALLTFTTAGESLWMASMALSGIIVAAINLGFSE